MKTIALTQGKLTQVDDQDFERLSRLKWQATKISGRWYATHAERTEDGPRTIYMHREIARTGEFKLTDHQDGDGLNNQRHNLRPANNSQNSANRGKQSTGGSSRFKGVSWWKKQGKWAAEIKHHRQRHFLGYFDDETEAARAYNEAAVRLFGEFARPNSLCL